MSSAGRPGNIGDDFKVYATDESGEQVLVLPRRRPVVRIQWQPGEQPALIFRAAVVNPVYRDPNVRDDIDYIKKRGFDINASFEDYEVQVNFMPRPPSFPDLRMRPTFCPLRHPGAAPAVQYDRYAG